MDLRQLQLKWFDKFDEIAQIVGEESLAAPFISVQAEKAGANHGGAILLVGKATDKSWRKQDFLRCRSLSPEARLEERQRASRECLSEMLTKQISPFWFFWNQLREEFKVPVSWTNLAKIGVMKGNPAGECLRLQKDLARATLKAEIKEYKPSAVFLVSGTYADREIVFPALGVLEKWVRPEDKDYWWLARTEEMPPVLWAYHPQGRYGHKEEWDKWIGQARRLLRRSY